MKTPCVGKCNIQSSTEYCIGCKRTITEIMNWTKFNDQQRENIMRMLKHRNIHKDI